MNRPVLLCALAMVSCLLCGCATNLEKARQCLRDGDPVKARRYFEREYLCQRDGAAEPEWNGRQYTYKFSQGNTVEALLGIAETWRLTNDRDQVAFYVGQLNDYALRHAIELPASRLTPFEQYLRESRSAVY